MEPAIRRATIDDLPKVQKLLSELIREESSFDRFSNLGWALSKEGEQYLEYRISSEDSCVLVATLKDEIAGYICGATGPSKQENYRDLPRVAEIENLFVLDSQRHKGIGKQLYNEFIRWCKEKQVKRIKVRVHAENTPSLNFHQSLGFQDFFHILERDLS